MQLTHPESNPVMERLAVRTFALMLAPVIFTGAFAVAFASLPAAVVRWSLSRG